MIVATVRIGGVNAVAVDKKVITAGMVGAQVQLEYTDPLWDSLHKTVVFYGAAVKDIITDDTLVTIPAEVIAKKNVPLTVGVYGVDAEGCVVIPTLLAELGTVRVGANPSGDTTTNPTLPVWAQVQQLMTTLSETATEAAASADASEKAAKESAETSILAEQSAERSAQSAKDDAASALESAKKAAASEQEAANAAKAAKSSENASAKSEAAAKESEGKAAMSQAAAQNALQGMVYVTFAVDDNGHVLIRNGDLLGSTAFSLNANGHLEVDY